MALFVVEERGHFANGILIVFQLKKSLTFALRKLKEVHRRPFLGLSNWPSKGPVG